MARLLAAALLTLVFGHMAHAEDLPSFMQAGETFCTSEADFDDLVKRGKVRPNSAIETCQKVVKPTRVAVMGGKGGQKTMIRVMNGPLAYSVGWTNGKLPLAK